MVKESVMICIDNCEYMRNGDFDPTRLKAQEEAVSMVSRSKRRSNAENTVGLLTMAPTPQLVSSLSTDVDRMERRLCLVKLSGETISLMTSIRVAHLALKHRESKTNKMRIVLFVGSPINDDENELILLAKRLKKAKVNVDVVNFGEEVMNTDKLTAFIKAIDNTTSHMITISSGYDLANALKNSPLIENEEEMDPFIMAAIQASLLDQEFHDIEDQWRRNEQRIEVEDKDKQEVLDGLCNLVKSEKSIDKSDNSADNDRHDDDYKDETKMPDFNEMTEEEQISYALQMSLQESTAMSIDTPIAQIEMTDNNKK
ncbi:26S proteasome non-ATPase regulatory subunit 4-like [Oppia nitens]|uniref:26S proteasome non-ATPase regulatory subunit 4-like n=1 Tax=Oppia nitens TaxID=1686743 RepID=UPI0023DBFFFD|nr:26S proteasome non-ATPase regulatory subunit 4-like [Oppia nitens]